MAVTSLDSNLSALGSVPSRSTGRDGWNSTSAPKGYCWYWQSSPNRRQCGVSPFLFFTKPLYCAVKNCMASGHHASDSPDPNNTARAPSTIVLFDRSACGACRQGMLVKCASGLCCRIILDAAKNSGALSLHSLRILHGTSSNLWRNSTTVSCVLSLAGRRL